MINAIPFVGWIISIVVNASLAIPFWILWTLCGIGGRYFYFLPCRFHGIGFLDTVGLFMTLSILKCVLLPSFGATVNNKEAK